MQKVEAVAVKVVAWRKTDNNSKRFAGRILSQIGRMIFDQEIPEAHAPRGLNFYTLVRKRVLEMEAQERNCDSVVTIEHPLPTIQPTQNP